MSITTTPAMEALGAAEPAICLNNACVAFGERVLWDHVDLDIAPGEFVAVLGPNGAGKTTLLRVLLGQHHLTHGQVRIDGNPVQRGSRRIGYVPQQKSIDSTAVIRGRDLVALGLDGDRWGITWPTRQRREKIDWALDAVGALAYADAPLSMLSGGEQQRLRIAQALVTDPSVLLCDEPLLSLDIFHQLAVTDLIDRTRREHNIAVLFVTHEINPVLPLVDRIIYFANGQALIGTPDEVMTTQTLSELYGRRVEVLRHDGQLLVFGADDHAHHPEPDQEGDA
ncbi:MULTISPECIES: metal ABC transporter ATP-binding protein [Aestuariimicrobium]|uniref:metal ABC transporter ATP-binding protein n=1 Tax=Aestuariimicrobium TaxID=396388 RepID=UPI0003B3DECB|nr:MULTISPECIES: ABC transporter ATP-binding protein [Aestuariimicrobium]CAI9400281.1 Zinc import ATP-binding protein ZnuC [Aestuariimicrobium sp. T2.26MG-19.2B]